MNPPGPLPLAKPGPFRELCVKAAERREPATFTTLQSVGPNDHFLTPLFRSEMHQEAG
jgi:hypothetical protein